MASDPAAVAVAPPPTIHEAERSSGPSGAVLRGAEIDFATAVTRRRNGEDGVVCGGIIDANRRLAAPIEAAVGPATRAQIPHVKAGPLALPHFHQQQRFPDGHTFYETTRRKARRKP